jgi:two-component system NtrC family response regulator
MTPGRVLVVEDDDNLRRVTQLQFAKQGYETIVAADAEQALALLQNQPQDLILTDLHLPGMSGLDLLRRVRADYPGTIVIVVTAFGTIESAVEAMKAGAYDYISKPVHPDELKLLVARALEHHRLIEEVLMLRGCLDQKYGFEGMIGSADSLRQVLESAARVAPTNATVLIRGETGTGKELLAKAIHFRSVRRNNPFVTINCGAIPRELLESELFGHVKGSFTGAVTHKVGKIEMADGGTLFLDEIGEMPLDLQAKVLRLIQEHELEKVGSTAPVRVDVRIIAATHRNLEELIEDGGFREDLYYRLVVVPLRLPPLRERASDIPELVQEFFVRHKQKHGKENLTLPLDLLPYFSRYHWPGNVRQLENLVERLVVLSPGPEITPADLPDFLRTEPREAQDPSANSPAGGAGLEAVQREMIMNALLKAGGNQTRAADALGVSRKTLLYRMEKYGIPKEIGRPQDKKGSAGST